MYHPELMSSVSQRLLYLPAGLHKRPSQDVVIHLPVPIYGRAHDALVYRPLLCHRKLGCGLNHGRRYQGWSRDGGRNSQAPKSACFDSFKSTDAPPTVWPLLYWRMWVRVEIFPADHAYVCQKNRAEPFVKHRSTTA